MIVFITMACGFLMQDLPDAHFEDSVRQCQSVIKRCKAQEDTCDRYMVLYELLDIRDQAQPEGGFWADRSYGDK